MRERGIVKAWLDDKEYGFIGRAGCADLFVHRNDLDPGALAVMRRGVAVEFEVTLSRSGRPQASSVTLAEGDN